ncbi:MAG: methylmalonic aciduria and homocystinuria type D protein [Scytolyngbya sp. HA4215-MV1]|jgi:hypothetical protein|nr:methylmalonic aciduria and homocystinuria type D protein [Scytolyngbya sp. HA4215-MV1]
MQCSVHDPNQFIHTHLDQLLPAWTEPVSSVLLVLQPSLLSLENQNPETEIQKQQLRQNFLEFGQVVATKLLQQGYLVDVFDPKTGLPVLTQPGNLTLDDVRVVHTCLGYDLDRSGKCTLILHPQWGKAVYPAVLVSSAHPNILRGIVSGMLQNYHLCL